MKSNKNSREETMKANIHVHSYLANAGEYQKSPHFRPENVAKVKGILKRVTANLADKKTAKAVDFGCGTGFITHLIRDRFAEVHGVDITTDMLKHIDLSSGNIFLHESMAEKTPFEKETFDFATAYSFMDHLFDYKDFLKEVCRVLKSGGVFYSDLNPNRRFIEMLDGIEKSGVKSESEIVLKEIQGALHNGAFYQESLGVDANLLEMAEPIKSKDKGFSAEEFLASAKEIGFGECKVEYEWYLGQGTVLHKQSAEQAELVNQYLLSILPASASFYKYLRFILVK